MADDEKGSRRFSSAHPDQEKPQLSLGLAAEGLRLTGPV